MQANGERVMTVIAASPAGAEPLLRITVPLGVLLPNGLNMTIDGIDLGTVGFPDVLRGWLHDPGDADGRCSGQHEGR